MIHPTAIIAEKSKIDDNVLIGPFTTVGPNVTIKSGTVIHSNVTLDGNTMIEEGCEIFPYATIGTRAQDLSINKNFIGNVVIEKNTTIREQVSIHASTSENRVTKISKNCFLMATSHVAHDCIVSENVIMANSSMLAGHVKVGKNVFISGGAAIHQFLRIGDYSFIIASSRTVQDVPPYVMTAGSSPTEYAGLNIVGLRRAGLTQDERNIIKKAYSILYKNGMKTTSSLKALENFSDHDLVKSIVDFVKDSERGIIRKWSGRNF